MGIHSSSYKYRCACSCFMYTLLYTRDALNNSMIPEDKWQQCLNAIRSLFHLACSFCPKCGEDLACPCNSCADMDRDVTKWQWTRDGNCCRCPICGFTAHADYWEAWSIEAFDHQWRSRPQRMFAMLKDRNKA